MMEKESENRDLIYYVFECGCTHPITICEKKKNGNALMYLCPKHGDKPTSKFMYCSGCGEKVVSKNMRGRAKTMCPVCEKINRIRYKKEIEKKRKIEIEKRKGVYLEYPCKCIKTREESVYKTVNKKKGWCCIEHDTIAVKRFIFCRECGKKTYVGLSGKPKVICEPCAIKKKNKRQKAYLKRQKALGKKPIEKSVINYIDRFLCKNFGSLCNQCIKPYFPCNAYARD